jgi:hypothetical protein
METSSEDDPKAWKWVIRKRIWDLMEARNIAQNPRPVHHRIPNFVGASAAAKMVKEQPYFLFFFPFSPFERVLCLRVVNVRVFLMRSGHGS